MKCKCGATTIEFTMSATRLPMFDGGEIGPTHGQRQCGFGYECHDCWGDPEYVGGASGYGFATEDEAIEALLRHIRFYCPPNWRSYTDEERDQVLPEKASWERYCTTRSSARHAQAVRDGWDG